MKALAQSVVIVGSLGFIFGSYYMNYPGSAVLGYITLFLAIFGYS